TVGGDDAGGEDLAAAEELRVEVVGGDAGTGQARVQVLHEGARAAEVIVGFGRQADLGEARRSEPAHSVEGPVRGGRGRIAMAVEDEAMGVRELREEPV